MLSAFSILSYREHRRHLMDTVSLSASRTSDIIRRATRASMLRNQRSELHEIIQNISVQEGIEGIRIYNKEGRMMFSTALEEVGEQVDLQAEACYLCHSGNEPIQTPADDDRARIYQTREGHRVMGWISPIPNEPDCSNGGCHAHSPDKTILGALDVRMSLEKVDAQLATSSLHMRIAAVSLVLIVAASFGLLIRRLVSTPVEKLIAGTHAVANGQLDYEIAIQSADDLGYLAQSFNQMTAELRRAREENRIWSETLEEKVREKTHALRRAHAHLMQMDRMASLGRLSATVAHEINNPLAGILTYARLVERELEEARKRGKLGEPVERYMHMISSETRRCGEIAQNLLTFARTSGARMESVHLLELVERSIALVQHNFDLLGIEVHRRIVGENDQIVASPGEIQQAIVGLLVNASDAMPNGGRLEVVTELQEERVSVEVADTGVGIHPENLSRIFEPFYTTKSATKGVGLGLAVVYGIMQRHGGQVQVQSKIDEGSTFTLRWPRIAKSDNEKEHVAAASGTQRDT